MRNRILKENNLKHFQNLTEQELHLELATNEKRGWLKAQPDDDNYIQNM